MEKFKRKYLNRQGILAALILTPVVIGLVWAIAAYMPPGIDWHDAFRPASLLLLSGRSPYENFYFVYPPWTLLPLMPFALLPEAYGRACVLLLNLVVLLVVAKKLGGKPLAIAFFLLSPIVMHGLLNSNIDWLVVIGFVLPPQIGLFFIIIKPQVGVAVGLFWLIDIWRHQGFKEVVRVFWPVTAALLLSFAIFGLWPLEYQARLDFWWNASLWPMSIPVGLGLLVAAVRRRSKEFAMAASPCFSPYILFHSYVGVELAFIRRVPETIATVIGLWIVVLIQAG